MKNLPITVQSQPTLTSTLTPPSICSDEIFEYVPTSALASTTYSWTRAVISGISNTNGVGCAVGCQVFGGGVASGGDVKTIVCS